MIISPGRRRRLDDEGLLPDPSPDRAQCVAAANAIRREFGDVIGENQATNIAYVALVAARAEALS